MHHGQEIYQFFGRYQSYGLLGILISSTIMGIIIYKVLKLAHKEKIENYQQLLCYFEPNPKTRQIAQIIIQLFLLISFYVMIAGFSAYFWQEWGISNYIGCATIIILCYIVFRGNIENLMKVNTILVPILIIFIFILLLQKGNTFIKLETTNQPINLIKAIKDAILYASYNSIILIPMLLPLAKCLKQKTNIIAVSLICTIILAVLAISIFGLILNIDINIQKLELPTVYVAGMISKTHQILYGTMILASIYTSAISAGYGFLQNYQTNPEKYKKMLILISIIAFFVSNLGFTTLVNRIIPNIRNTRTCSNVKNYKNIGRLFFENRSEYLF